MGTEMRQLGMAKMNLSTLVGLLLLVLAPLACLRAAGLRSALNRVAQPRKPQGRQSVRADIAFHPDQAR